MHSKAVIAAVAIVVAVANKLPHNMHKTRKRLLGGAFLFLYTYHFDQQIDAMFLLPQKVSVNNVLSGVECINCKLP